MKKKTRYVILGLLRDEAMSGYQIKQSINTRMSFFWNESYGQLYPELNAMEKEGFIEVVTIDNPTQREKNLYKTTRKGLELFNQWMALENDKDTIRSEALLKFFLADDQNKESILKHLDNFQQQNKAQLKLYQQFYQQLVSLIDLHNNHKYIIKMLELGIAQKQLYCDWAKNYRNELQRQVLGENK